MKSEWIFGLLIIIPALATPVPQHGSSSKTVSREWLTLQQSIQKMHATMMSAKPSGNCDLDFVKLMVPHHRAALDMAKAQLRYGKDPQINRLAQEIITDQQSEIELMQLWLKQHEPISQATK
jgi:uncharacterized protein (DUF305 family)